MVSCLLSASVRVLKQKSPVDRILRQQKAHRQAREEQIKAAQQREKEKAATELLSEKHSTSLPGVPPVPAKETKPGYTAASPNVPHIDAPSMKSPSNILKRFSNKLANKPSSSKEPLEKEPSHLPNPVEEAEEQQPLLPGSFNPPNPPPRAGPSFEPPRVNNSPHVTPLTNIGMCSRSLRLNSILTYTVQLPM